MANNDVAVVIPKNTRLLLLLCTNIYKQHKNAGAASKLNVMDDVKWDNLGQQAQVLLQEQDEVDEQRRQAEKRQGEIDRQKETFDHAVRATRDLLLGIFRNNPKALGDYGFEVNKSRNEQEEGGGGETPAPEV